MVLSVLGHAWAPFAARRDRGSILVRRRRPHAAIMAERYDELKATAATVCGTPARPGTGITTSSSSGPGCAGRLLLLKRRPRPGPACWPWRWSTNRRAPTASPGQLHGVGEAERGCRWVGISRTPATRSSITTVISSAARSARRGPAALPRGAADLRVAHRPWRGVRPDGPTWLACSLRGAANGLSAAAEANVDALDLGPLERTAGLYLRLRPELSRPGRWRRCDWVSVGGRR